MLGRSGEAVKANSFGAGGRLVLAVFGRRAATFDATTGNQLTTLAGNFSAISPDGSVAVSLRGSTVSVVDLETGVGTVLETGSPDPIDAVRFVPDSSLLVAEDPEGIVVRVLRCAICASDDELLRRARATLAVVSTFHPHPPPIAVAQTG